MWKFGARNLQPLPWTCLSRGLSVYTLGSHTPVISSSAWIAHNATVIGMVSLGERASIWFNATLRGDCDWIRVGHGTNIQDGSVLHTDEGVELVLGERVTVGHMVCLHGCSVGDDSLIGIGSTILNHAVIGKGCLVGANSFIPEGKQYPDNSLILGAPAKVVGQVTPEQHAAMKAGALRYMQRPELYSSSLTLCENSGRSTHCLGKSDK